MVTWLRSKWRPLVLNLQLTGKINQVMAKKVNSLMEKASFYNPKMIALTLNSEGGSVVQMRTIANIVREKAEELKCPVYTFATDAAMGSAFALLCAGSKSFADAHSLIGGVGFSLKSIGVKALIQHLQVNPTILSSAKEKVRLSPFEELKPEDEEWISNLLAHLKQCLHNEISSLRSHLENANLDDIVLGRNAVQNGWVDSLGDLYTVVEHEFPGTRIVDMKATDRNSFRNMSLHEIIYSNNQTWDLAEEILKNRTY